MMNKLVDYNELLFMNIIGVNFLVVMDYSNTDILTNYKNVSKFIMIQGALQK